VDFNYKILVIRFSSIGDIVLSTSALKTIRNAYPEAEISFLTLEKYAPILEQNSNIDRIILFDQNMNFKNLLEFSDYIKNQNYTQIYDLHNSLRSNVITFYNQLPVFKIKKPRWNRLKLFQFHKNDFSPNFSTLKMYHESLVDIWKEGDDIPNTSLFVSIQERIKARNITGVDKYTVLIPGAAWHQKQWPAENYIDLIKKTNMNAVLIGSYKDEICQKIYDGVPSVLNLAGKTNIRDSLAIISESDQVIGSDTGFTHAAEALNIPVTMLMGPTSRETGGGVLLDKSVQIEKDIWCRPCSQNGKRPCYRATQLCINNIDVNDIIQTLRST
tara:strand:+ start:105 stop:1091 length:987 start_codon:yes stop_codon:yes gene_type:complete